MDRGTETAPIKAPDFVVRRVRANDGISLYVRDYPGPGGTSKVPVMCLGGLTRNSKDFAAIGKAYGAERRVICPDMRGRGQSEYDPDWRHYRPETYVADIRDLLCALGIHQVVVIGTSLGGILAMALGAAMPTVLCGLILNDVGPRVETRDLDKIVSYMKNPPTLATWLEAGAHLRAAFGDQVPLEGDGIWAHAARSSYVERAPGQITYDWDDNLVKPILADKTEVYDLWHLFNSIRRFPVLVVRGEISKILSVETLTAMHQAHPGMRSITVPGLGHAPTLGEPVCIEAIKTFLTEI